MRDHAALDALRGSSFAPLHLRHNPFAVLTLAERARAACVETTEHARFLGGERRALQLLGDHGRGKSTLLVALHVRHFEEAPFVQLHGGDPVPERIPGAPLRFVDSVENLGWLGRQRLYRRCVTLALTTHRDLSRELLRAGFEVRTVRVAIKGLPDLRRIVDVRIRGAALPTGEPPRPTDDELRELYGHFGTDVRSIEAELFDRYEGLRRPSVPGLAASRLAASGA